MAKVGDMTVRVNVEIELDGEPISTALEMPATYKFGAQSNGLTINLKLDHEKLAKALLPHLTSLVRTRTSGARSF